MAPIIVMIAGTLLRLTARQLPGFLAKGARRILKPTTAQIRKSRLPRKPGDRTEGHIKRVKQKAREEKYIPKTDPEGYKDIYKGDEKGVRRLQEVRDMEWDEMLNPPPDKPGRISTTKGKRGGSVRGKQRGIGKALRGGGAVTRG